MSSNKSRILIIEDDPSVRSILQARLSGKDGHDVLLAEDGESGLRQAEKEKVDLIILDWMMPGLNGFETLKALKNDEQTLNIPVFMLTGKKVMDDIERAFEAGADGYFTKPIRINELSKRVLVVLNNIEHGSGA